MTTYHSAGIPSIDLNDFLSNDTQSRARFVNDLGKAYEEIGFVALKGHLLPDHLSADLYEAVKSFFALPFDVKEKYEIPGLAGQRGYTSFGKEHAKGRTIGDLKEFWQFGQYLKEGDNLKSEYPDNVSVTEIAAFNELAEKTYKALEETGKHMLRAIAIYLGLDEFYFDNKIEKGNSILRAIHYGPIHEDPKDAVRAAEHEDINLITLLMGASAEGLEVLNKQGEWVAITALPEQLVVNVGDMLQR
jgi:isopenicillin N synthase-like dioxygenase